MMRRSFTSESTKLFSLASKIGNIIYAFAFGIGILLTGQEL